MYAITATSYRAITAPEEVTPGEVAVEELPQELLDYLATLT